MSEKEIDYSRLVGLTVIVFVFFALGLIAGVAVGLMPEKFGDSMALGVVTCLFFQFIGATIWIDWSDEVKTYRRKRRTIREIREARSGDISLASDEGGEITVVAA